MPRAETLENEADHRRKSQYCDMPVNHLARQGSDKVSRLHQADLKYLSYVVSTVSGTRSNGTVSLAS